ncbi:hypothetical protein F5Y01DRAFT_95223 [Xylaria sp. FL0043]|nr:hypothetical protein F5Y01DRAFT_95223 [Xylaria sp. FL0043]
MENPCLTQGTKRRYSGEQGDRTLSGSVNGVACDYGNTLLQDSVLARIHYTNSQRARQTRSTSDEKAAAVRKPTERGQQAQGNEMGSCREDYYTNLYSTEPDFHRLGLQHPEFGAMLKGGAHLDFTDPAAVMQLTKTLLKVDFGIQINLPPNRLCPPVPNRHNYILWLKELLDSTSPSYSQQYDPERKVTGVDIGTGASLIYPLLGCVQRPNWHFIATDIDAESLASARENARLNNLEARIHIVDRRASDSLVPDLDGDTTVDFVMVNPPFYSSDAELQELAAQKSQPPHSACTGAPVEMVCEGGEVEFVERIINESLLLRGRVQWYTAMLGKQSSIEILIGTLKKHKINNFAVTTFIQGSKTRRWALGWSFLARRPSMVAAHGCGSSISKNMLPPATEIFIYVSLISDRTDPIQFLRKILRDTIGSLSLRSWGWDDQRLRGVGFADGNVWSRAYRRRRAVNSVAMDLQESAVSRLEVGDCAFGFSVSIQSESVNKSGGSSPAVILCWLQGDDESLFESFSGVIRRCLRTESWG